MEAEYESATETLTLTWEQPSGSELGWNVYMDDAYVTTVSSPSYSEDLSSWGGGERTYYVTALQGNVESEASASIHVSKVVAGAPLACPVVTIFVTSLVPPQVYPAVNEECIPGP